jgi:hypothetical protein
MEEDSIDLKTFIDIPTYEGRYQINKLGQVLSLPKIHGRGVLKDAHILKERFNDQGYVSYVLAKDGVSRQIKAHYLVMLTFVGDRPIDSDGKLMVIDHIDTNRSNNKLSNLQYLSRADNIRKIKTDGNSYDRRGDKNPKSKLTWEDVINIRNLSCCMSQTKLGENFGISQTSISKIILNLQWVDPNWNPLTKRYIK